MKLFGREPALWIAALTALLGLFVTFPLGMTGDQATAIVASVTALGGVMTAWQTRPWAPGLFNGLITSLAVLGAGYGLNFTAEQVGLTQAAVMTLFALIARGQISPKPERPDEQVEFLRAADSRHRL